MSILPGGIPEGSFPDGIIPSYSGLSQDQLLDIALNPQTITVDGRTVTEHSLADLIALDKHLAAKQSKGWGSIRINRISMPGGNGNG